MSTYLLAFSVSKLTCSKSDGNVSLKVCSRDKFVDDRSFALNHGLKLINAMNSWTNFNYSEGNSKLDQFAIPGITELAMENWGFVTYQCSINFIFTNLICIYLILSCLYSILS